MPTGGSDDELAARHGGDVAGLATEVAAVGAVAAGQQIVAGPPGQRVVAVVAGEDVVAGGGPEQMSVTRTLSTKVPPALLTSRARNARRVVVPVACTVTVWTVHDVLVSPTPLALWVSTTVSSQRTTSLLSGMPGRGENA